MSDSINQIRKELESLGYETSQWNSSQGTVVCFPYTVETGSYKGTQVMLGISMQGSEPYPEYPPHWIHLSPPIDDGRGGVVEKYSDANGWEWSALSRPPGEIWDQLRTKHMYAYLSEHMRRFLEGFMTWEVVLTSEADFTSRNHLLQHYRCNKRQEDLCFALWRPSTGKVRTIRNYRRHHHPKGRGANSSWQCELRTRLPFSGD